MLIAPLQLAPLPRTTAAMLAPLPRTVTFLLGDWIHVSLPKGIWRCRPQIPCWRAKASSCTCWGHTLGSQGVACLLGTCSQAHSCNITWLQDAHSARFNHSQAPELTSRSYHAAIDIA